MPRDKKDRDDIDQRWKEMQSRLRVHPPPEGDDVPEWLRDGIEDLYDFFNSAAALWDERFNPDGPDDPMYQAMASQIDPTDAPVRILDLGCGTGCQLEAALRRAPNAKVTAIDLVPNMLEQLRLKLHDRMDQITLIEGSLLHVPLGDSLYDYAISSLTMHHFPPDKKQSVYGRIRTALAERGIYIEGDQSVLPGEQEEHYWYHAFVAKLPGGDRGAWNYDITLSEETQTRLLRAAGFREVSLAWERREDWGGGVVVLVAKS